MKENVKVYDLIKGVFDKHVKKERFDVSDFRWNLTKVFSEAVGKPRNKNLWFRDKRSTTFLLKYNDLYVLKIKVTRKKHISMTWDYYTLRDFSLEIFADDIIEKEITVLEFFKIFDDKLQEKENTKRAKALNVIERLKKHNMTAEELRYIYYDYNALDYDTQRKIDKGEEL